VKSLSTENSELTDQLEGGGKQTHEIEKLRRKLEADNEELKNTLEETETLLTMEENKTSKLVGSVIVSYSHVLMLLLRKVIVTC